MSKELVVFKNTDWYQSLLDDCSSIHTEYTYNSRLTLVEGYFELGKRLREDSKRDVKITKLVQQVATDMEINERNLWYAIQAVDKFGTVDNLPFGKDISWSRVRAELPAHKKRILKEFEADKIAIKIFNRYGVENSKLVVDELNSLIKDYE